MKKNLQLIGGPHDGLDLETDGEEVVRIGGLEAQLLASIKVVTEGMAEVPEAGSVSRYRLQRDIWQNEAYVFEGWE